MHSLINQSHREEYSLVNDTERLVTVPPRQSHVMSLTVTRLFNGHTVKARVAADSAALRPVCSLAKLVFLLPLVAFYKQHSSLLNNWTASAPAISPVGRRWRAS